MSNNFLLYIWRGREEAYSSMIAQTLILSRKFRKFIEKQLEIEKDSISIIETEKDLDLGRIDIYFEYENGLAVGIENKKWAKLQANQLHKYDKALQKNKKDYKLVFLSPSTYTLSEGEKPENLVIIKYKEIIDMINDWIKELNHKNELSEFEETYFKHLLIYLEDLEMKPIQDKEIESLLFYDSCETKLKAILNELMTQDERTTSMSGNYILFSRKKDGFLFFTGFRFGTKWYYQDTLLNKSPECIIYVKDIWDDSEQQEKNILVKKIYDKLKEEPLFSDKVVKLDIYQRSKKNECRLAIRRSLSDFKDKDFDEIIPWFRDAIVILEKHLTNTNSR